MIREYVVGFVFDQARERVLLIEKRRPKWQAGCLNGLGGKIEFDDPSPEAAMAREFQEEAGCRTLPAMWDRVLLLRDPEIRLYVMALASDAAFTNARATTDEALVRVRVDRLPHNIIANMRFTVPLAAYPRVIPGPENVLWTSLGEPA